MSLVSDLAGRVEFFAGRTDASAALPAVMPGLTELHAETSYRDRLAEAAAAADDLADLRQRASRLGFDGSVQAIAELAGARRRRERSAGLVGAATVALAAVPAVRALADDPFPLALAVLPGLVLHAHWCGIRGGRAWKRMIGPRKTASAASLAAVGADSLLLAVVLATTALLAAEAYVVATGVVAALAGLAAGWNATTGDPAEDRRIEEARALADGLDAAETRHEKALDALRAIHAADLAGLSARRI